MSNPHHRRRKSRPAHNKGQKPAEAGSAKPSASKSGTPPGQRGGRRGQPSKSRWVYDVRHYALLTDDVGNLLILQLPKEYDAAAANTWTLPGGKLEPSDEPG